MRSPITIVWVLHTLWQTEAMIIPLCVRRSRFGRWSVSVSAVRLIDVTTEQNSPETETETDSEWMIGMCPGRMLCDIVEQVVGLSIDGDTFGCI